MALFILKVENKSLGLLEIPEEETEVINHLAILSNLPADSVDSKNSLEWLNSKPQDFLERYLVSVAGILSLVHV